MDMNDNKKIVNLTEITNAIVAQACTDYRDALRGNGDNPEGMLRELMRFFKSDWYKMLTKVDYQYLLDKLNAEWEDGKKLIEAGINVDCPKVKKRYTFDCPLCGGAAVTHIQRIRSQKRKDGTRPVTYYKIFECGCHRPEKIFLRQEVINHEDNQN